MMNRKKKLRFTQISFLLLGLIVIAITFLSKNHSNNEAIISKNLQKEINKKLVNKNDQNKNKFYNVNYSGLDLEGNRYTIKSKEATNSDLNPNIVVMNNITATFYFKDSTKLKVLSRKGEYNNKSLDIKFDGEVKAFYEDGKLSAEKAEFSNSQSFLTVSEKVKIIDQKGTVIADKMIFDLNTKKLNITSEQNNLIKSNIKLK